MHQECLKFDPMTTRNGNSDWGMVCFTVIGEVIVVLDHSSLVLVALRLDLCRSIPRKNHGQEPPEIGYMYHHHLTPTINLILIRGFLSGGLPR